MLCEVKLYTQNDVIHSNLFGDRDDGRLQYGMRVHIF